MEEVQGIKKWMGLFVFTLMPTVIAFSQTITGNVVTIDHSSPYALVNVQYGEQKVTCDSLGYFTLNNVDVGDTLEIIPFPLYRKVKIYNFQFTNDSVNISAIPLFNISMVGSACINFRSKRAARKYYKKQELRVKEIEENREREILDYRFNWHNNDYKFVKIDNDKTLYLDLK